MVIVWSNFALCTAHTVVKLRASSPNTNLRYVSSCNKVRFELLLIWIYSSCHLSDLLIWGVMMIYHLTTELNKLISVSCMAPGSPTWRQRWKWLVDGTWPLHEPLLSVSYHGIHLRATSQERLKISIIRMCRKITHWRLPLYRPRDMGLTHNWWATIEHLICNTRQKRHLWKHVGWLHYLIQTFHC